MRLDPETATIDIEFDPKVLFAEIVRELINAEDYQGTAALAAAILDGIDQLPGDEQVVILDEITDPLRLAAEEMREDDEE